MKRAILADRTYSECGFVHWGTLVSCGRRQAQASAQAIQVHVMFFSVRKAALGPICWHESEKRHDAGGSNSRWLHMAGLQPPLLTVQRSTHKRLHSLACALFSPRPIGMLQPTTLSVTPLPLAGIDNTRHNYLLLGLALFQFPLNAWLARLPPLPAAAAGAAAGTVGAAAKAAAKAAKAAKGAL